HASLVATVRSPQPEKDASSVSVAATRRACSWVAIPAKRQWPAFDVRTLHACFLPSSASAYVESSSHQKLSSNRRDSVFACLDKSRARTSSPKSLANFAAASLAA